ncbi:hypothetical protein [Pedobacter sp. UC225_65]|uniref:hypothetical protein n=1 Tax=Pedobacter sp. UC225_65 TaxID=3350173 RepID=UPI00366DFB89
METKSTLLKSSLLALLLFISSTAFSATYYVCAGATLNLSAPVVAGTSYMWDVKQGGTSISGYPSATAPTSLPSTGTYQIILLTTLADPLLCAPNNVVNDFIVLPALTLTIATPTNPSYCGSSATVNTSVITPTLGAFPTGAPYTTDLEAEYSYSVVKDGGTAVNGTTVGTINATTGAFTLTATAAGTYVITGTVKYKQKTGFTGTLLGTTGCPTTSTSQTVTVTGAPAAPVITISAS